MLVRSGVVITSIKPKAGDKNLLVIRIGRAVLGTVTRRDAAALGLEEGASGVAADEGLISAIADADEYVRCRGFLVRAINKAPLTRAVAEKRAADKGFSHGLIQRLLGEFGKLGLINDEQVARAAAAGELARKPAGTGLVRDKLLRRGVEEDLAEAVAEEATAGRDLLADAIALCRQRVGRASMQRDATAARRRLFGLLGRRGFELEVAERAIEAVLGPAPEGGEGGADGADGEAGEDGEFDGGRYED